MNVFNDCGKRLRIPASAVFGNLWESCTPVIEAFHAALWCLMLNNGSGLSIWGQCWPKCGASRRAGAELHQSRWWFCSGIGCRWLNCGAVSRSHLEMWGIGTGVTGAGLGTRIRRGLRKVVIGVVVTRVSGVIMAGDMADIRTRIIG